MSSRLICNDSVSWVTFHNAYDFEYLAKILTQRNLPNGLMEFLRMLRVFFRENVYDGKHMMRYGGLNQVAMTLNMGWMVDRGGGGRWGGRREGGGRCTRVEGERTRG